MYALSLASPFQSPDGSPGMARNLGKGYAFGFCGGVGAIDNNLLSRNQQKILSKWNFFKDCFNSLNY